MKKWSWLAVVLVSVMLLFTGVAVAKVSGPCVNCHTMHYSQHGKKPGETGFPTESPYDLWTGTGGPYGALLVDSCVGCHSGATALKGTSNEIPVVLRTTAPSGTGPEKSLAGGDFYWVANGDDTKGHNVDGVASVDGNLGYDPPGWDASATAGNTFGQVTGGNNSDWGSNQLTCAGMYGCHGKHTETTNAAVAGAHHGDDSCLHVPNVDESKQGQSVVTSYRWCGGIHGIEDSDWEWTASDGTTDHNQYKGVNGNNNYSDKTTISYLCAECHGVFHSDIGGTSSPWTRHPTDFDMGSASGTEYQYYNGGSGGSNDYSVIAPVGSSTIGSNPLSTVNAESADGTAIVLCVSCHRAHGTEYDDLLRWDYSSMVAGGGAGNV
ncbi:MAG: hypothetical protein J7J91_04650, partial [Deltaproteobacteria bacterium]|nr:hypothetical protein [Deltaproteobacteria bacterium]